MIIGVPKEIKSDESRVGLTPAGASALINSGHTVNIEKGAGFSSGFNDNDYSSIGCEIIDLGIIYDDYNESKKKILDSTKKCDLIITTGGISTGKTDNISKVLQVIGQLDVWRLCCIF